MRIRFVKINTLLVIILSTMLFNNIECVNATTSKLSKKSDPIENSKKSINKSRINGATIICELKDNKKAAYSFTTDDGIYNAIQYYNEDFRRLHLKGSMALITANLAGKEDNFRQIVNEGYFDVTNHSMSHIKLGEIKDSLIMETEINKSQLLLKSIFKDQDVITMANPYVNNSSFADSIIKQNHYAARNGKTGFNSLSPTENEWFRLNFISTYNYNTSQPDTYQNLNSSLNAAMDQKKWLIILAHGIGSDRNSIPKFDITTHFEYVASKLDSVWCGTINEVTKYIREKQHAALNIKGSKSTKIVIELTHDLNKQIFNFPLTLKTKVPSDWIITTVVQKGITNNIKTKFENGAQYVYYEVVPNLGNIKLTKCSE